MPCHDDREYTDADDIKLYIRMLNERTDMLCQVLRKAEAMNLDLDLPMHIKKWWKAHQKLDQKEGR